MLLKNETAIITGGTSGIGKKLTEHFLSEGCKVAICGRNQDTVQATVDEFTQKFQNFIFGFPCDVADPIAVKNFVDSAAESLGSIRIAVPNAGVAGMYGPFDHIPYDQVAPNANLVISTILLGTLYMVSAVLPHMIQQKYGRIITLTGGGADRPLQHMTTYSAAKGGVVAFSKCLAVELAQRAEDIKVNIYAPGMIRTGLTNHADVVPNWMDPTTIREQTDMALQYMGNDLATSTRKVISYALPSCKANGTIFRGFAVGKMIRGAMKLQKMQKQIQKERKEAAG